ncbi:putative phytol kinase 1, chloroplastic isoform X1 [Silene latifolia]|uniref:putative phytol kinase 1, chloroplastic isoform X1 n=1 Tax=Silene latifolia TaxID=37657 RepID=UPI003D771B6C
MNCFLNTSSPNLQLLNTRFAIDASRLSYLNSHQFHRNYNISIPIFRRKISIRRYTYFYPQIRRTKAVSPPHAVVPGDGAFIQDAGATALVLGGGYAFVSVFEYLTQNNIIPQKLSRKLVHILSGLFFMVSWPLFSTSSTSRYFASLVPLANGLKLLVYGLSLVTDEGLVKSVTREGKPEELLRGPLYYVLILALCAVVFWRDSPVGLISLSMMSGGDGVADIMGRKFGTEKIPYNKKKSWAGSISMFAFGFLTSLGMLYYFSSLGYFQLNWVSTVKSVAVISFLASVIESLPIGELIDDNLSVPLATMIIAYMCFSL